LALVFGLVLALVMALMQVLRPGWFPMLTLLLVLLPALYLLP